jgi:hypothetical protein
VKSIEVYGEMHRYVPVLAKWAGFRKITEKVVEHRPRKYGVSKFGWTRFINGFLDLLTIFFIGKFGKRPMHFFGLWGSLFFLLGFIFSIYLVVSKIIDTSYPITNRPGFFLAMTSIIIGMQLFLAGFIGELVTRNAPGRNAYLIEDKTGFLA